MDDISEYYRHSLRYICIMSAVGLPWTDAIRLPLLLAGSVRDHVVSRSPLKDLRLCATWKNGVAAGSSGPLLVSFTQYAPYRLRDFFDIWKVADVLGDELVQIDSAYGVVTYLQPFRRLVGSLSVWTDERGLADFVGLRYHGEIMRRYRPRGLPLRSARWWTDTLDVRQAMSRGQHLLNTSQDRRVVADNTGVHTGAYGSGSSRQATSTSEEEWRC